MVQKPELLAPAGTWDSLVAAVENGADAVYLGGKMFSARQSAANFDHEEIQRAVYFAHVRGVKVYVTVNILLDEVELIEAVRFLYFLQTCGVDAVLVQDLGLANLAGKVIPELPVHASTQMTIHNLPGAKLLQQAGFERIVLARELSLAEIEEFVLQSGLEVEVFVHGALCICYSGQCLMSSLIGGRSGNRGRCAQPCRLQYTLVDVDGRHLVDPAGAGEYLLSPRDLNMSGHLPDLVKAGISALKIEGRMKRPEYVATVVRIYRELLDRTDSGEGFFVSKEEARQLAQVFNRDFTTGYFYGRPGKDLMSWKRPNNRGVRIGRIKGFNRQSQLAEVVLESPLRVGDGIEVWVSNGGRAVGEVNRILLQGKPVERAPAKAVVQLAINGRVFPGDRVFKTHDADLIELARTSFTSPKELKKIPLAITVEAKAGEPLRLQVMDPEGYTGEAVTSLATEAVHRPLTAAYLEKQLDRMGNTPFKLGSLSCRLEGQVMVPVSELNEARREALAQLEARRAAGRKPPVVPEEIFNQRLSQALSKNKTTAGIPAATPVLSVAVGDLASLRAAVKAGAGEVQFGGEQFRSKPRLNSKDILSGSDICRQAGVRFILTSPRIMHDQELADFCRLLDSPLVEGLDGILTGNLGLIKASREITGIPVFADFSIHVFNHAAADFLRLSGVKRVTLSPELTLEQVRRLAPLLPMPAEAIVHGALPLMVSAYCAPGSLLGPGANGGSKTLHAGDRPCAGSCRRAYGLKDRKGVIFPVETDRSCRMHIFNSRELCMIDDLNAITGAGVAVVRIEAGRQSAEYVSDVVKAYHTALKTPVRQREEITSRLKDSLLKYSEAGFTKGHYYRGVIN